MADLAFQWIDAAGTAWDIENGTDITLMYGTAGRHMPLPAFVLQALPTQAGQRFADVRQASTTISVPVDFYGVSDTTLRASIRNWAHRLDPTRGDGRLRTTAPGGDQRELICRYSQGLEAAVEDDRTLGYRMLAVLDFVTEQPFWQDTSDTSTSYQLLSSLATFFPLFPLRLSGSEIFASATVVNAGDVEAWPVWVITGPGSMPVLVNQTTGKTFSLNTTLLAGDTVTVDTRPFTASNPRGKTITKSDGTNLYSQMNGPCALWPLAPGSNALSLQLTGASATLSKIQLNYRNRWLSA